jgi:hypothetical protein
MAWIAGLNFCERIIAMIPVVNRKHESSFNASRSVLLSKSFNDRPSNVIVDEPLIVIHRSDSSCVETMCKNLSLTFGVEQTDGLGPVKSAVFVSKDTGRWFHAYEYSYNPSLGVHIDTDAKSPQDLSEAMNEVVRLLALQCDQIAWHSQQIVDQWEPREMSELDVSCP